MKRKYFSLTGVRVREAPLIETSHPPSATAGSTLTPTVCPGVTGMTAISSSRALATSPAGADPRSTVQSLDWTATLSSDDQQIASRCAEVVPEKTVTLGAGFSQAASATMAAAATSTASGVRGDSMGVAAPIRW